LNFLAQSVPDALCTATLKGRALTETDTFTDCVYPRNELIHQLSQDNRVGCYCPQVAKPMGQSNRLYENKPHRPIRILPLVKRGVAGSNIFVGCSISRKIETLLQIDQGRSLCV